MQSWRSVLAAKHKRGRTENKKGVCYNLAKKTEIKNKPISYSTVKGTLLAFGDLVSSSLVRLHAVVVKAAFVAGVSLHILRQYTTSS
jgi:hypothetical protein